ncbi:hypothetical protein [Nonomuraea zeae]|uniref:Uncharacterized protein n=1 Tax=Nonomuraea zeae TaxID=1642303 RepID=A0A5S4GL69_9ACTN|nr:hypothetical protein [Nonomuraea zeae]TMR33623.1 hypothetical protein ETD85_19155 [Nonomuraea zeae]
MYPELFLYAEKVRAGELRAEAERHRLSRPSGSAVRKWETRLGWALVETGLRLVHRTTAG